MPLVKTRLEDGSYNYIPKGAIDNPEYKVTVEDLDEIIAFIFSKKSEIEEAQSVVSTKNKELSKIKQQAVLYLKELGRTDFKSDLGTIKVDQKLNVKNPQSEEDFQKFNAYLKEKGLYERLAKVNNKSLNSLYSSELKEAVKRGDGMSFSIPGIGEPTRFTDLKVTKARTEKEES